MSTQDVGRQEAARTTPSAQGAYDEPGGGWLLFAGIMLMVVGVLNVIWGIAAIPQITFRTPTSISMIPANRSQPPPGSSYAPSADRVVLAASCLPTSCVDIVIPPIS